LDISENKKHDLRFLELEKLKDYDGCFFLAWDVGGSKYLNERNNWNSQFRNNIALINNVIPQIERSQIPFLFVSSQLAGVDESPYSLTKLLAENYCKTIKHCVIARQWNAYGTLEELNVKSHVVSDLIMSAITKKEINLLTNGQEKRKFVHISDICEAYLLMLNNHLGSIYDVSSEDFFTILEIAEMISKLTGAKININNKSGVNPKVLELPKVPGWKEKIDLKSGIEDLIKKMSP
jgi:nucleoside-diphosphate-sugar epimerase